MVHVLFKCGRVVSCSVFISIILSKSVSAFKEEDCSSFASSDELAMELLTGFGITVVFSTITLPEATLLIAGQVMLMIK